LAERFMKPVQVRAAEIEKKYNEDKVTDYLNK
jgi:hypothetical protein